MLVNVAISLSSKHCRIVVFLFTSLKFILESFMKIYLSFYVLEISNLSEVEFFISKTFLRIGNFCEGLFLGSTDIWKLLVNVHLKSKRVRLISNITNLASS